MSNENILKYTSFSSLVNPNFWHKLTQIKLDIDRLSDEAKYIWGFYSNIVDNVQSSILEINSTAFNTNFQPLNSVCLAKGIILNKNTIEEFKEENKVKLIEKEGKKLWKHIVSGEALSNPSLLSYFIILSFADLKNYKYYYWFAFPAPTQLIVSYESKYVCVSTCLSGHQIEYINNYYENNDNFASKSFFIFDSLKTDEGIIPLNVLKNNDYIKQLDNNLERIYFAFADPSNDEHPGWPLRNYLALLLYYCPVLYGKTINILSIRLTRDKSKFSCKPSLIFKIIVPPYKNDIEAELFTAGEQKTIWSGWEKNERGNLGPRMTDMRVTMDPMKLSESSVDLNLKLMKWRILPSLNIEKIQSTKCLLLGAGTLGCSVARTLLGWGIRHITFVDNGYVSYANPVRQSLYFHEDCLGGGKPKAEVAAVNVKKIFPGIVSSGYVLKIPMPGHTVSESLLKETKESIQKLIELIKEHDVIYLLMDSRESRWLPTVLSAYYRKIVINAALGFDTYLVMRHGVKLPEKSLKEVTSSETVAGLKTIPGSELGCYFCNNVTAPGNSLKDRTLDQQCTVTRPGVSSIAGSLAVELMVSILEHKDGPNANAYISICNNDIDNTNISDEGLLGIIPHSIRGFLSSFSQIIPATIKYKSCIACSDTVLQEFDNKKFEFLLKVFNSTKYLEDLTGLSDIQRQLEEAEIWELSESDD